MIIKTLGNLLVVQKSDCTKVKFSTVKSFTPICRCIEETELNHIIQHPTHALI